MEQIDLKFFEVVLALYAICVGIVVFEHMRTQNKLSKLITDILDCLETSKNNKEK